MSSTQRLEVLAIAGDATYREREAGVVNGLERGASGSTVAAITWRRASERWVASSRAAFAGSDFRNTARLPLYARLDVRANRTFVIDRRRLTLFVEVMNVPGRRNLGQAEGTIRPDFEVLDVTRRLIPRVPSAGLLIAF